MQGASKRGSETYLSTLSFRASGNEAELARSSFARASIVPANSGIFPAIY